MATAKPIRPTHRRRWPRRILALAGVAAAVLLAWSWRSLSSDAVTAASYGARIACPCRFIAGRELSDCKRDFEPGMGLVVLSEDVEARSVTARVPLLASQTAAFREGEGCRLEPWEN